MTGITLFVSKLIHAQINKIFIWKNIKKCITHKTLRIYQNAILVSIIAQNIAFRYKIKKIWVFKDA